MQNKPQTMNNEGIATLLPMSDIEKYNKELRANTRAIYVGYFLLVVILLLAYWFFNYYNIVDYVAYKFRGGC